MDVLKKIACMLGLLLWAGGLVCALILVIGAKALVPILSVVVLGLMGIPAAKKMYDYLVS